MKTPDLKDKLLAFAFIPLVFALCACKSAPREGKRYLQMESVPYQVYVSYGDIKLGKTPLTLDAEFLEKIANSTQDTEEAAALNLAVGESIAKFYDSPITIKKIKDKESLHIGNSGTAFTFSDGSGNSLDGEVLKLVWGASAKSKKVTVVFKAPPEILEKCGLKSEE